MAESGGAGDAPGTPILRKPSRFDKHADATGRQFALSMLPPGQPL